ncbi:MAG: hypothetical protein AAGK04_01740 [Planctomycetota bacterium]
MAEPEPRKSPSRPVAGSKPHERYTIRRKLLKVLGAAFHVYATDGMLVAYCQQKAFKLREDIRLYTDESKSIELFSLKARSVLDFSTTYDVALPTGESLGSLRRKGLKSTFLRDQWLIFDAEGRDAAEIKEKNATLAMLRRLNDAVATFAPQTFEVFRPGETTPIARFRQHFNPIVFRMGVEIIDDSDLIVDELVILAAACLISAIEGRQD